MISNLRLFAAGKAAAQSGRLPSVAKYAASWDAKTSRVPKLELVSQEHPLPGLKRPYSDQLQRLSRRISCVHHVLFEPLVSASASLED